MIPRHIDIALAADFRDIKLKLSHHVGENEIHFRPGERDADAGTGPAAEGRQVAEEFRLISYEPSVRIEAVRLGEDGGVFVDEAGGHGYFGAGGQDKVFVAEGLVPEDSLDPVGGDV